MQSNQRNYKTHFTQAFLAGCAVVFLTALILAFFSWTFVLSFLAGAVVLMLAHTLFFFRFFFSKNYQAHAVTKRFYTGALIKWLVLILGCALAFKFNLALWPFVLAFVLVMVTFYLTLFLRAYFAPPAAMPNPIANTIINTKVSRSCAS